jgi:cytochrome c-type biogenesis protein CcmH/NrfG
MYTARIFDHPGTARAAFAAARAILEKQLREEPNNALTRTLLGRVKAALGEKQEAIAMLSILHRILSHGVNASVFTTYGIFAGSPP